MEVFSILVISPLCISSFKYICSHPLIYFMIYHSEPSYIFKCTEIHLCFFFMFVYFCILKNFLFQIWKYIIFYFLLDNINLCFSKVFSRSFLNLSKNKTLCFLYMHSQIYWFTWYLRICSIPHYHVIAQSRMST